MFPSLAPHIQAEIAQLTRQYGQPLQQSVELPISKRFDPLSKTDRYSEVCMVVRRPNGRLITMAKTYYPPRAFRLLTGGINHGETIFDALLRETYEETGLEVRVERFLGAVAYTTPGHDNPIFYTFAFLLDETGGTFGVVDTSEEVGEFREVAPDDLLTVADNLEQSTTSYSSAIDGSWADWGHFRAIIHRLVWQAMHSPHA